MKKPYEQFIKSISEAWPGTPESEQENLGRHKIKATYHPDIGSSVLEALEQPLDEGKIITQDSNKALRPGKKHEYDIIKKYPAANGNIAYVVMQGNGFHGVLVLDKNNNLIRSYINARDLEKAHIVARHYAAKGDIGMNQVVTHGWTHGGGFESVIGVNESDIHVKEEQLEERISQYASFLTR